MGSVEGRHRRKVLWVGLRKSAYMHGHRLKDGPSEADYISQ